MSDSLLGAAGDLHAARSVGESLSRQGRRDPAPPRL